MSDISNQKGDSVPTNYLRRVNLIRFVLPILLFTVVAVYETQEHWMKTGRLEFDLVSEIVFLASWDRWLFSLPSHISLTC
jgi:hypothetical protein